MFAYLSAEAEVRNLNLLNVNVRGRSGVGSLAGYNAGTIADIIASGEVNGDSEVGGLVGYNQGTIRESHAEDILVAGHNADAGYNIQIGGLVGRNRNTAIVKDGVAIQGIIENSSAEGRVSGNAHIGGLVGDNEGIVLGSNADVAVNGIASSDSESRSIGGLVGYNFNKIFNSYAVGDVSGDYNVGGLAGSNYINTAVVDEDINSISEGRIVNSYASGRVAGDTAVGGLVGRNDRDSEISSSYALGDVSGNLGVGGLVGWNFGAMRDVYASSNISGSRSVGGLVGGSWTGANAIINSYAVASVQGVHDVGGLAGHSAGGVIDSYWDTVVSGLSQSGGGSGRTTADLQRPTEATGIYVNWNASNWHFGTAEQYPVLKYVQSDDSSTPACETTPPDTELPDCNAIQTYGLMDLEVSDLAELMPKFRTSALRYNINVEQDTRSLHFIPSANERDAVIHITNHRGFSETIDSGTTSSKVPLNPTVDNTITITVEGKTVVSYRFDINYFSSELGRKADADSDGLIEIYYLEDLNAMRHSLDGKVYRYPLTGSTFSESDSGCPDDGCRGYELVKDLDFTDAESYRSGRVNLSWTVEDFMSNSDRGWDPIGGEFNAVFAGNGYTIHNLQINGIANKDAAGLFNIIGPAGRVENLNIRKARIRGLGRGAKVGSLAGENRGVINNSHIIRASIEGEGTNRLTGSTHIGGLVGLNNGNDANIGDIKYSSVQAYVRARDISAENNHYVGGLAGGNHNGGKIHNSYMTGSVDGSCRLGGLVGEQSTADRTDTDGISTIKDSYAIVTIRITPLDCNIVNQWAGFIALNHNSDIANSYAVAVQGQSVFSGFDSRNTGTTDVTNSYWNSDNIASSGGMALGKTTAELQSGAAQSSSATNVYYQWSEDNWDFGTASQYPALKSEDGSLMPGQWDGLLENINVNNAAVLQIPDPSLSFDPVVFDYYLIVDLSQRSPIKFSTTPTRAGVEIEIACDDEACSVDDSGTLSSVQDGALITLTARNEGRYAQYQFTVHNSQIDIKTASNAKRGSYSHNEGETLTLNGELVALDAVTYSHQWSQVAGPAFISDTKGTFTLSVTPPEDLVPADAGHSIIGLKLEAYAGEQMYASKNFSWRVNKINNGKAGEITITPKADEDRVLSVSLTASASDPDKGGSLSNRTVYLIQWQRCNANCGIESNWRTISERSTSILEDYTVPDASIDYQYRLLSFYRDGQGYGNRIVSDNVLQVEAGRRINEGDADGDSIIYDDTEAITDDIDADGDGLIEIRDLEDLNAIRHQLDGRGKRANANAELNTTGCPFYGCSGYELVGDLDFAKAKDYRSGTVNSDWRVSDFNDADDISWQPIDGESGNAFNSVFNGNGHTISNLQINRSVGEANNAGLFGRIGMRGRVENLRLEGVTIKGLQRSSGNNAQRWVGGITGNLWRGGAIVNSYVTGSEIHGDRNGFVGGLVGNNRGYVLNSYAKINVQDSGTDKNTSVGGLVGRNLEGGRVHNSYATGNVKGACAVGGLVGSQFSNEGGDVSEIKNSYATGNVQRGFGDCRTSFVYAGGLVGNSSDSKTENSYSTGRANLAKDEDALERGRPECHPPPLVGIPNTLEPSAGVAGLIVHTVKSGSTTFDVTPVNSYWNSDSYRCRNHFNIFNPNADYLLRDANSKSTAEMRNPTGITGIYSAWSNDDWDFGSSTQYPEIRHIAGPDRDNPGCGYGTSELPRCGSLLSGQQSGRTALTLPDPPVGFTLGDPVQNPVSVLSSLTYYQDGIILSLRSGSSDMFLTRATAATEYAVNLSGGPTIGRRTITTIPQSSQPVRIVGCVVRKVDPANTNIILEEPGDCRDDEHDDRLSVSFTVSEGDPTPVIISFKYDTDPPTNNAATYTAQVIYTDRDTLPAPASLIGDGVSSISSELMLTSSISSNGEDFSAAVSVLLENSVIELDEGRWIRLRVVDEATVPVIYSWRQMSGPALISPRVGEELAFSVNQDSLSADVDRERIVLKLERIEKNNRRSIVSRDIVLPINKVDSPGELTLAYGADHILVVSELEDPDGTLSDIVYRWQRDNSGTFEYINDANRRYYFVPSGDRSKTHRLEVSYIDGQGHSATLTANSPAAPAVNSVDRDGDGLIEIAYIEQLDDIRHQVDGTGYNANDGAAINSNGCPDNICKGYELVRDLDFDNNASYSTPTLITNWNEIGNEIDSFTAIFEGNGFTISNLNLERDSDDTRGSAKSNLGLFGVVSGDAEIRRVRLANVNIVGSNQLGALVGNFSGNRIIDSHVISGRVKSYFDGGCLVGSNDGEISDSSANCNINGNALIGGLVGKNHDQINNSFATGNIIQNANVTLDATTIAFGGLVGRNIRGRINNSYSTASINRSGLLSNRSAPDAMGGLVGINDANASINNSYATNDVIYVGFEITIGGLVGISGGPISNSYATGAVRTRENVGGLVGELKNTASINNSYATGAVHAWNDAGGLVGKSEGSISDSYATGAVRAITDQSRASRNNVGGLVGNITGNGRVSNSYATGNVEGRDRLGGLVGESAGSISDSHATGNVEGRNQVGGLVGTSSGPISDSHATGAVRASGNDTGGLVGLSEALVVHSFAIGNVTNTKTEFVDSYSGGLVGRATGGSSHIRNSYATGDVEAENSWRHGGLVGRLENTAEISNSFATGNVATSGSGSGGLVGNITGNGRVSNSYAIGSVKGSTLVGGLVGSATPGVIRNSYAIGSVEGTASGGLIGGNNAIGLTVSQSYWSLDGTGQANSLGAPTADYRGFNSDVMKSANAQNSAQNQIYDNWDFGNWDFGTAAQYPALKYIDDACNTAMPPEACGTVLPRQRVGLKDLAIESIYESEDDKQRQLRITPSFDSSIRTYELIVAGDADALKIIPRPANPNALITADGVLVKDNYLLELSESFHTSSTIKVSEPYALNDKETISYRVRVVNRFPKVDIEYQTGIDAQSCRPSDEVFNIEEGSLVCLRANILDVDGDRVGYSWQPQEINRGTNLDSSTIHGALADGEGTVSLVFRMPGDAVGANQSYGLLTVPLIIRDAYGVFARDEIVLGVLKQSNGAAGLDVPSELQGVPESCLRNISHCWNFPELQGMPTTATGAIAGLGTPELQGTSYVTSDTSSIISMIRTDPDGAGDRDSIRYQWQREVKGKWVNIADAHEHLYAWEGVIDGKYRVIVSYIDGQGFRDQLVSESVTASPEIYERTTFAGGGLGGLRILYFPEANLSPRFSSLQTQYTAEVENDINQLTLSARVSGGGIIHINGEPSDTIRHPVELALGMNQIIVSVLPPSAQQSPLPAFYASQPLPQRQEPIVSQASTPTASYTIMAFRNYNTELQGLSLREAQSYVPGFLREHKYEAPINDDERFEIPIDNETDSVTVFARVKAGATITFEGRGDSFTVPTSEEDPDAIYTVPFTPEMDLAFGETQIDIQISAPRATTRSYIVVLSRPKSMDATLKNMQVIATGDTPENLTPPFDSSERDRMFSATVPKEVSAITLKMLPENRYITGISLDDRDLELPETRQDPEFSGRVSGLRVGSNEFNIIVTAQDGQTTEHYVMTVVRSLSDDATLASFDLVFGDEKSVEISNPSPSPAINQPSTTTIVEHAVSSVALVPFASIPPEIGDDNSGSTIQVNGNDVGHGDGSSPIDLTVGENIITINVTAEDRKAKETYRSRIIRKGDDDDRLDSVVLFEINSRANTRLERTINIMSSTDSISVGVANEIDKVMFEVPPESYDSPVEGSPGAEVCIFKGEEGSINIHDCAVGQREIKSREIEIDDGETQEFTFRITPEEVLTYQLTGDSSPVLSDYRMTVKRAESADNSLENILLSRGLVGSVTERSDADGTTRYRAVIDEDTEQTTVTAVPNHKYATVKISVDGEITTGTAKQISIKDTGISKEIKIIVTAQNGNVSTHTLVIFRQESSNTELEYVRAEGAEAVRDGSNYTARVGENDANPSVTVKAADDDALVALIVDNSAIASSLDEAQGQINIPNTGDSVEVTIRVTAQNGDTEVYTLTVIRNESSNSSLRSLEASVIKEGSLGFVDSETDDFDDFTEYSGTVAYTTETIVLAATGNNNGAKIKADVYFSDDPNGTIMQSIEGTGELSAETTLNRLLGENQNGILTRIRIVVTSQNGQTSSIYQVRINRDPSPETHLTSLTLSGVPDGEQPGNEFFSSGEHSALVTNATAQVDIQAQAFHEQALIRIVVPEDGDAMKTSTGNIDYSLEFDSDVQDRITKTLRIRVTAQDRETTRAYTVRVTRERADSENANLDRIVLTPLAGADKTPVEIFATGTTLEAEFPYDVASVRVAPLAEDGNAMISIDGETAEARPTTDVRLVLDEPKIIEIQVMPEDPNAPPKSYTLSITRKSSSDTSLESLEVVGSSEALTIEDETRDYQASIGEHTMNTTVTVSTVHPDATVRISSDGDTDVSNVQSASRPVSIADTGGSKTLSIEVTAQDESFVTYTVRIERDPSSNSDIASIAAVNPRTMTTETVVKQTESLYEVNLANQTTGTVVTVSPANRFARVIINDRPSASTGSQASEKLELEEGEITLLKIRVIAQNASSQTYSVRLSRAASTRTDLNVSVAPGLVGNVERNVTTFTAVVSEHTTRTVVTARAYRLARVVMTADDVQTTHSQEASREILFEEEGLSKKIQIKVLAQNPNFSRDYTLLLSRQQSSDVDLRDLQLQPISRGGDNLSAVALFNSTATVAYRHDFAFEVAEVRVLAQAYSLATISVNGESVENDEASSPLTLNSGETRTITVVVTAQNGEQRSYTIAMARMLNNNADIDALSVLSPAAAKLEPAFVKSTTEYRVINLTSEDATMSLNMTVEDIKEITIENQTNGASGRDCTDSCIRSIGLNYGENEIVIRVEAQAGNSKTYFVNVFRPYELRLISLTLDGLEDSTAFMFDSDVEVYTTQTVSNESDHLIMIPGLYPGAEAAGISFSVSAETLAPEQGEPQTIVLDEGGYPVPITVGHTRRITIQVTAPDQTIKRYVVPAFRIISDNTGLADLELRLGEVPIPDSSPELITTGTYSVSIDEEIENVEVYARADDDDAEVTLIVNNAQIASSFAEAQGQINIPNTGDSVEVTIRVTAQNREDSADYTLTVMRAESANSRLSSLEALVIKEGSLGFIDSQTEYSGTVAYTTETIVFEAISDNNGAHIKADVYFGNNPTGTIMQSIEGTSELRAEITLSHLLGENRDNITVPTLLQIVVSSQNGQTSSIYQVRINRDPSPEAYFTSLDLVGVLNEDQPLPEFLTSGGTHRVSVANAIDQIGVQAQASHEQAKISIVVPEVNAMEASTGNINYNLEFDPGERNAISRTIRILVTAQDQETTRAYTIAVMRAEADSENADLDSIVLTPLTGANTDQVRVSATTTTLVVDLPDDVERVRVAPLAEDGGATISIDEETAAEEPTKDIALELDVPVELMIQVMPEDTEASSKSYTLRITRKRSSDTSLESLEVGSEALTIEDGKRAYQASIGEHATTTTVTIRTTHPAAMVRIGSDASRVKSASRQISIDDTGGSATLDFVVIAQDGTEAGYMIRVERDPSSNNDIASITAVNPVTSAAEMVEEQTEFLYEVNLANQTTGTVVTARADDRFAKVTINGKPRTSAGRETSMEFELEEGEMTTLTVIVTAQNTVAQTYSVRVSRAASTNTDLDILVAPGLVGNVEQTGTTFTAVVSEHTTRTVVTAQAYRFSTVRMTAEDAETSGPQQANLEILFEEEGRSKEIQITVVAQNRNVSRGYTLLLSREQSSDADLRGLQLQPISRGRGELDAVDIFDNSETAAYEHSFVFEVAEVKVLAQAHPLATISIDGESVENGAASPSLTLTSGEIKNITVVVTAQNGDMQSTYTIAVTRMLNENADIDELSVLTPATAALAPNFVKSTTEYRVIRLTSTSTAVSLNVQAQESKAITIENQTNEMSFNCTASCDPSIPLDYGENRIVIRVEAQAGNSKDYFVDAYRPYELRLTDLRLGGLEDSTAFVFNRDVEVYPTQMVSNERDHLIVTPSLYEDAEADGISFSVIAQTTAPTPGEPQTIVLDGSGYPVPITVGHTRRITIRVTAPDGTMKDYIVPALRIISDNTGLAELELRLGEDPIPGSSPDLSTTGTYSVSLDEAVENVEVYARADDDDALVALIVDNREIASSLDEAQGPINIPYTGDSVEVTIRVTAQNGDDSTDYILIVTRAESANSSLSSLEASVIKEGSLNFVDSETDHLIEYSGTVASTTETIVLSAMGNNNRVHIKADVYFGNDPSGPIMQSIESIEGTGELNAEITLNHLFSGTPDNIPTLLRIVVSSQNGQTSSTYQVRINRDPSPETDLTLLTLSGVEEQPSDEFLASGGTHRVLVANAIDQIEVQAQALHEQAEISIVVPEDDAMETDTGNIDYSLEFDSEEDNEITKTIRIIVTAQDQETTRAYTIVVTRAEADSENANLDRIVLTPLAGADKTPVFATTTTLEIEFPDDVASVRVAPSAKDGNAMIRIDSGAAEAQPTTDVTLVLDVPKTIEIQVIAQDPGVTPQSYTLRITRKSSSDTRLESLKVVGSAALTIEDGGRAYRATLGEHTMNTTVTVSTAHPFAMVRISSDGDTDVSNVQSANRQVSIADTGGSKTLRVVVTAQDGSTATYTIRIERDPSSNSNIASITAVNPRTMTSERVVKQTELLYEVNLANQTTGTVVTVMADDRFAKVTINGKPRTSAGSQASAKIELEEGEMTTLTVIVTAQNTVAQTYSMRLSRAASTNTDLNILVAPGLVDTVEQTGTTFTAVVSEATTRTVVTAQAYRLATVTMSAEGAETSAPEQASREILLEEEGVSKEIQIRVVAQNRDFSRDYTLLLSRQQSSDADLRGLQLQPISRDGDNLDAVDIFNTPETDAYEYRFAFAVAEVKVLAQVHPLATISINGESVENGVASPSFMLNSGERQTITMVVTAQNGAPRSYTIAVTRAEENSRNANLDEIVLTPLTGANTNQIRVSATTTTLEIEFPNDVESVRVAPIAEDGGAMISIDGRTAEARPTAEVALEPGVSKMVEMQVTPEAQDASSKTYTLHITRKRNSDTSLESLRVGSEVVSLSPIITRYIVELSSEQANTAVDAMANNEHATLTIQESSDSAGPSRSARLPVTIAAGNRKEVTIEVTAQNGDTDTYSVIISRASVMDRSTLGFEADLSGVDPLTFTNGNLVGKLEDANIANTVVSASVDVGGVSIQHIRVGGDTTTDYVIGGAALTLTEDAAAVPISRSIPVTIGTQITLVIRRADNTEDGYTEASYTIDIAEPAGTKASSVRIRAKIFLEGPLR